MFKVCICMVLLVHASFTIDVLNLVVDAATSNFATIVLDSAKVQMQ